MKLILIVFPLLLISSCTFHAMNDVGAMRDHALSYYNTQIIDNLVRASNGMPILHVNVTGMNSNITGKASGAFDGGETQTRNSSLLRTVARPLTFKLTGEYTDTVTATTAPINTDGKKYEPYLKFLNLERPTQRLQSVSDIDLNIGGPMPALQKCEKGQKPVKGEFVPGTLRAFDGFNYFVPIAYRQAYFDLCLDLIGNVQAGNKEFQSTPSGGKKRSSGGSGARALSPNYFFRDSQLLEQLDQKLELLRSQNLSR